MTLGGVNFIGGFSLEKKLTEKIKVFALGGVGEIGKNMYVVEVDEQIFVLDSGLMFPEDGMFGIDVVIPDISYLIENQSRVKAIFLTNGHDDHIGAIPYVLKRVKSPVYAPKLTLSLVKEKLKEHHFTNPMPLHEIRSDTVLSFGEINISFFRTNHNIPDSIGISIATSQGAIVYTGNFKFDQTPVSTSYADIGRLVEIGEQGVLCLLSDSTNAEKPGYTGSEAIVGQEISDVIYNSKGRVVIACFATNITRLQQVLQAAEDNNRKVVMFNRARHKVIEMAAEYGHLTINEDIMISPQTMSKYEEKELLILTLSHQGEPMSALPKMAKQTHKQLNIKAGDTVIIASTPMPGKELAVSRTIDALYRAGANVVYNQQKINVSGHGCQEELKCMINLTRPKYLMPVRGEFRMQKAHTKVGKVLGMSDERMLLVDKGDVVEFKDGQVALAAKVTSGNVLIDGLGVGDVGNIVLRDRRLLSQDGIVIVVVTLSRSTKVIVSGPEIITRGFVYVRESEKLLEESTKIVADIVTKSAAEYAIEWSSLKLSIREALNQYLFEKTRRRPMILPIIMEI